MWQTRREFLINITIKASIIVYQKLLIRTMAKFLFIGALLTLLAISNGDDSQNYDELVDPILEDIQDELREALGIEFKVTNGNTSLSYTKHILTDLEWETISGN